jgi:hypothetical protein
MLPNGHDQMPIQKDILAEKSDVLYSTFPVYEHQSLTLKSSNRERKGPLSLMLRRFRSL